MIQLWIGKEVLSDLCPVPHGNMKGDIHREGRAVYAAEQTPQEEVSQGDVPERRLIQLPLQPLAAKHRPEVLTGGGVKGLLIHIIIPRIRLPSLHIILHCLSIVYNSRQHLRRLLF